jgi:replicative DNA helicase
MKVEELEKEVDLLELARRKYNVKQVGVNTYRINPCPVCGHNDHFTIYADTNSYSSFNGCVKGGSVYKFLQEVEGLSEEEAYEELKRLAGYEDKKNGKPKVKAKDSENYTEWVIKLYNEQTEEQRQYFIKRGLSSTIEKYKLSVAKTEDGLRAILPYWKNGKVVYYTARALEGQEPRYKNLTGTAPLFNEEYLTTAKKGDVVVICEGIFDALSIEETGHKAIALGGTQHLNKLFKAVENTKGIIFLTAFDNDEAGKEATEKAKQRGFTALEIPAQYKDINEWYIEEPEAVKKHIKEKAKNALRPDAVSVYLKEAFYDDIVRYKTYMDKKTGFDNLDKEMGGLYAGLYVIGGISSVGKTTFIHQLADQLAEQGEHVIFFSLEQSKLELVSKSLSRLTARIDFSNAVSGLHIRSANPNISEKAKEMIQQAFKEYQQISERISIVEGNYNTTVESVRQYIERYININDVKPFVIIDYLQILQCENNQMTDKQRIDYIVTELKRISRDFDITLFVISSLNRGNYLTSIDFESFKESGGIEYTADVILGLQLAVINEELFAKEGKLTEKREKIKEAKAQDPRRIELVCLKNRHGKPYFKCLFQYYPKYDLFIPEGNL